MSEFQWTGWNRQKEDRRDHLLLASFGISETTAVAWSLKGFVKHVHDQGRTNSCVAHALASAVGIIESKAGLRDDPISRRFLYYYARRVNSNVISDSGAYMRSAASALFRFGAPPERSFKWDDGRMNEIPPWISHMRAHSRMHGEYAFIKSKDDRLVREIMSSICAGYPVAFGTMLHDNFTDRADGGLIRRPKTVTGGGHAMLIVGYKTASDGGVEFDVLNSWGREFGDEGFCRMSEDYMTWEETSDFVSIRGWSRLRR